MIEKVKKTFIHFREKPKETIFYAIIAILIIILLAYTNGFFGKKGEKAAMPQEEYDKDNMQERLKDRAGREINVKNGGIGSVISNEGEGTGLEIQHHGNGTAELISVEGKGVGEIITNTGKGTGKKIISTGGEIASETNVLVDKPAKKAAALISKVVITTCDSCGQTFSATKVIQGFIGDEEPKVEVKCPYCGAKKVI